MLIVVVATFAADMLGFDAIKDVPVGISRAATRLLNRSL